MSLLIRGGKAFIGGKFVEKDILIENGIISKIGPSLDTKADETLHADNFLVLPGLIDPHVHMREPGATYKEDFYTGGRAAIAGGFTTVMDMPNNPVPTITKERLEEKIGLAKQKSLCDVLFHFGTTDNNFDEIKKADPQSLKIYLGKTTGDLMLHNPASLETHYKNFPKNRPIVLHCGSSDPDPQENMRKTIGVIKNAASLAKKTKNKIHLAHASTKNDITVAKNYAKCTVEVAPHYLFLSSENVEKLGVFGKVYPPLRPEQKRIMMLSALELVDCIATDHAPHTPEDKENGAAGFPGLETSFGLIFDLCNNGILDKIRLVQLMSENPAKIFGINNKGMIKTGYMGDITIVDPKKEWVVDALEMHSKCKWSPFQGKRLKGKVHTVVKGGNVLYREYEFVN
ncbi:dihydroorotase family protein [Candidatus Micrarchaeota archaeon]|nr:dihydroorotase family protein [Candidatus Micrarchaeota archaeon]MBU1886959.1 dihydroorotase family protein [Candidatus Micrarchaeota archaeon]